MRPTGNPMNEDTSAGRRRADPVAVGFTIGVAFGLVALLVGLPKALLVLSTGVIGAIGGLAYRAIQRLQPAWREALEALLHRRDLR